MKITHAFAGAAAVLLLSMTGCASDSASTTQAAANVEQTPTETPTPTPSYVTNEQVASVIGGYRADWQEIMDGAGDCRLAFVFEPSGLEATTCTFTEQTMGATAQLAMRDLEALDVPPELQPLVGTTTASLARIAEQDFATTCLVDGNYVDSDPCTAVLGARFAEYITLSEELGKWEPYL